MVLILDSCIVVASGIFTLILTSGWNYVGMHMSQLIGTLCFYLIFYVIGFLLLSTYKGVIRYSSFVDLYRVALANGIAFALIFILHNLLCIDSFLLSISAKHHLIIFVLATMLMWLIRVTIKMAYDSFSAETTTKMVFIYGTKKGGVGLAKNFNNESPRKFSVKGFVSDGADMVGKLLMGHKVYANDDALVEQMRNFGVKIFVVPPLKQKEFIANQNLINRLIEARIKIIIVDESRPWDGKSDLKSSQFKEVEVEDLLPRDEIEVNMEEIRHMLHGKRVLITGSAGSIGSEIVRQVAQAAPEQLILIDEAETPQHDILLMMHHDYPEVKADIFVETICGKARMEDIFSTYHPVYVFHAAAYKHVPMMEMNPYEAVVNNVGGTKIIADLSMKYGVRKFVMISTDKAVNPTNVMGCSKRICEIYCQSLDKAIKEGILSTFNFQLSPKHNL